MGFKVMLTANSLPSRRWAISSRSSHLDRVFGPVPAPDHGRPLGIVHGAPPREKPAWMANGCSAPPTSPRPKDQAAAYKQLLTVERGWRDVKGILGLRPVFRYREDRTEPRQARGLTAGYDFRHAITDTAVYVRKHSLPISGASKSHMTAPASRMNLSETWFSMDRLVGMVGFLPSTAAGGW